MLVVRLKVGLAMPEERLLLLMRLFQGPKSVNVLSNVVAHGIYISMDWVVGIRYYGQQVRGQLVAPLMTFCQTFEHSLILDVDCRKGFL